MSTNYVSTFIIVSPDTTATVGTVPPKPDSIAGRQYALLAKSPYRYTSDELLFEVHVERQGRAEEDREHAWDAFFSKPQACLRASPLVKQYGWGIHHDPDSRIALCGMETDHYKAFTEGGEVEVRSGMRSRRT